MENVALEILALASLPILIALNGFFVAAEFALVAVRKTRVEEMVQQGLRGAKDLEHALLRLDQSIAASQLGITLASIALGMVAEPALKHLLEPLFTVLPESIRSTSTHVGAAILALAFITAIHVVLGEQVPKVIALQEPDRSSLWVAAPLNVFVKLTRPLVSLLNGTSNWIVRRLGYQAVTSEESAHSLDELALLIEDTEEAGLLDPEQAEIVQSVFRLSGKRVRDCMVPRDKMEALELSMPPDKVLEAVRQGAHTRMPVYDGDPNNIVGVVNTKNLFHLLSLHGAVNLYDAMYDATFLDPQESLGNALRLFRRSRRPMAMVRDEAGQIHGLLTLEDILEEIVGDIEDEHDRPVPRLSSRGRRGLMVRLPRPIRASPPSSG